MQILKYCLDGWLNKSQLDPVLKPYWDALGELMEGDGWTAHVRTENRGPKVTLTHCTRITQLRGKSLHGIFFAHALVVAMPSEKECASYVLDER